jgi:hypothetical protein
MFIYILNARLASAFGARCAPAAFFFFFCCSPLRVIEHPRACGARPAMFAPSALAAGAARLRQALRACHRGCAPAAALRAAKYEKLTKKC